MASGDVAISRGSDHVTRRLPQTFAAFSGRFVSFYVFLTALALIILTYYALNSAASSDWGVFEYLKNVTVSLSILASIASVFPPERREETAVLMGELGSVLSFLAVAAPHKIWFYAALSLSPLAIFGLVKGDREASIAAVVLLTAYLLPPWAYAIFLVFFLAPIFMRRIKT
ncbi:MAG: hypothetical protein QXT27_07025 [Pyrobaculum sp.]